MSQDRLEQLSALFPFGRLNRLLENVPAGGGDTPLLLHIGEPQFAPPSFVAETLAEAAADWGRYPPTAGTAAFRKAVKEWLDRRYRLPEGFIDADKNVLPVAGSREGLFHIALSAVAAGLSRGKPLVLMGNPFYHAYAGAAAMAGAEPRFLTSDRSTGFLPDISEAEPAILDRTAMVYLCSPGNPTGAVMPMDTLRRWVELARKHDFVLASDECYSEVYREVPPPGALEAARDIRKDGLRNVIVAQSLSKRSSAPGLRSGFVAGDAKLIQRQTQMVNYGGVATPLPILAAATKLWSDESHVIASRAIYNRNFDLARRILGSEFGEIVPAGGFFLWLDVGDGEAAALTLWRETGIKVLPGAYMGRAGDVRGRNPGDSYVRIALVLEPEAMEKALHRMAPVLRQTMRDRVAPLVGEH